VNAFLTHLAVELHVSASTQNPGAVGALVSVVGGVGAGSGSGGFDPGADAPEVAGGDDR
jgi:hypothetical protein